MTACKMTYDRTEYAASAAACTVLRDTTTSSPTVEHMPLDAIRPAPENDRLYRPVDPDDPEIVALAESVAEIGIVEPLVITRDRWIFSGHRRYAAARLAGLTSVPCRVEPISRMDNLDQFVRLLREYNRQRTKSLDEQPREEVVSLDPQVAYKSLLAHRRRKSDKSDFSGLTPVSMASRRRRKSISQAKQPMLAAVQRIIEERREFWPLSDRSIHYALLNGPPLRHAAKPGSTYANDRVSYQDLTNLLTRTRLAELIPWEAIADEARPVLVWQSYLNAQAFLGRELDRFLRGYWRDYQRSQPNHIEIVAEELSVRAIVESVAMEYCVPLTIGRGYCSITPRRELGERYRRSGREKLIILFLSDFDPDGENIATSSARSLRDDFGIDNITAVKLALTGEQVRALRLPPQMKAKTGASTYTKFAAQHGDDVFELEALPPAELQRLLRETLDAVIEADAFQAELEAERAEAVFLEGMRQRVRRVLPQDLAGDDV
jgi:ParB-like chromosome segregation protein Spo0J